MNIEENTYDEQFEDPGKGQTYASKTLGKKKPTTYAEATGSKHNTNDPFEHTFDRNTSSLLGINTDYGKDSLDKSLHWSEDINKNDVQGSLNEHRAQEQSTPEQVVKGLDRTIVKAGTELAKTASYLGGAVVGIGENLADLATGEDNHNFLDTTFNNFAVKALDNLNSKINDEWLPVYVKKSVQDGDVIDKMKSTAFWATDGADGLGYMLSAMAPGAAFKALGLSEGLLGMTAKNLTRLGYADDLGQTVSKLAKLGFTAENVNEMGITAANVFFEAGAESKGVSESVLSLATERITIPKKGGAESLNAGVSAGILCALLLPC